MISFGDVFDLNLCPALTYLIDPAIAPLNYVLFYVGMKIVLMIAFNISSLDGSSELCVVEKVLGRLILLNCVILVFKSKNHLVLG